ncbi:hypothetical protein ACV1ED_02050 [Aeromonas hydrophila]
MIKPKLPLVLSDFLSNMSQGLSNWISLKKSNYKKKKELKMIAKAKAREQKHNASVQFTMTLTKDSSHLVVLNNTAYRVNITTDNVEVLDGKGYPVQEQELLIQILREIKNNGIF